MASGENYTLGQVAPIHNVDPSEATSRLRVTFDTVDMAVETIGTSEAINMGGALIPKGARILFGQVSTDGVSAATSTALLSVGGVLVTTLADVDTAASTLAQSGFGTVVAADAPMILTIANAQTVGVLSCAIFYTLD